MPYEHPLLPIYLRAARGEFPPADGQAIFMPSLQPEQAAVVSFTARAYIATSLSREDFADFELDGFGSAIRPRFLTRLAGATGHIFMTDMALVGRGRGGGSLPVRDDLEDHIRVRYARTIRTNVRVHGDERGFITLADGLAGRPEMSIEINPGTENLGAGRALIGEALKLTPMGEPLFAAVSPGNARSARAFLAMGFVPIGSEVIIDHRFIGPEP
jgi:hypothetical protein